MIDFLENEGSTYHSAFVRLANELESARAEAKDNVKFLQPLLKPFEKLNMMDEFPALVELFQLIMHLLMLIWKHSKHYNKSARVVTLIQEICNDLIMQVIPVPKSCLRMYALFPTSWNFAQACKFLPGEELIQMEPQEAIDKLRTMLKVLGDFKTQYFNYKRKTVSETPDNPWQFQNSALFLRLDAFLERCHDMLDVQQTCLQVDIARTIYGTCIARCRQDLLLKLSIASAYACSLICTVEGLMRFPYRAKSYSRLSILFCFFLSSIFS